MSTNNINNSSLSTLPVELIYRILDILDNKTILFSFGNVSKRFRSIIHSYNQYKIDFQSISKPCFHSICQLIYPVNIISLILSNDNRTTNQITEFLSLFPFDQFIRLHSLTLIEIDEDDFHNIFQFNNINLSILSFKFRNISIQNSNTLALISSVISNKNLRHLNFGLSTNQIEKLIWPNQCLLESLILSNRLTFEKFSTIMSQSLHLKKIVLQDCIIKDLNDINPSISYPQLTSLTLEDSELSIEEFQLFLTLTPSLEHLHIIGGSNLLDGSCWETLIKNNLLKLNRFEFAFCGTTDVILENSIDVESLIQAYRSKFWIEVKHWFVVCYYFKESTNYSLYSLPICKSKVKFYPHEDKISCSTYSNFYNDISMTDNVNEMQLNLTDLMANYDQDIKDASRNHPFFRKLKKLLLIVDDEWPDDSSEYLAKFIDLSSIVELIISVDLTPKSSVDTLLQITHLLEKLPILESLAIDSLSMKVDHICLLVPHHVKHLQVPAYCRNDMQIIIENVKQLSSITFEISFAANYSLSEFVTWLMEHRKQSAYRIDRDFLSIWFNNENSR